MGKPENGWSGGAFGDADTRSGVLKEVKEPDMCRTRGRVFQAERMAGAKALWWEQAYCICRTKRATATGAECGKDMVTFVGLVPKHLPSFSLGGTSLRPQR